MTKEKKKPNIRKMVKACDGLTIEELSILEDYVLGIRRAMEARRALKAHETLYGKIDLAFHGGKGTK